MNRVIKQLLFNSQTVGWETFFQKIQFKFNQFIFLMKIKTVAVDDTFDVTPAVKMLVDVDFVEPDRRKMKFGIGSGDFTFPAFSPKTLSSYLGKLLKSFRRTIRFDLASSTSQLLVA
jgi:hypothetical protein